MKSILFIGMVIVIVISFTIWWGLGIITLAIFSQITQ